MKILNQEILQTAWPRRSENTQKYDQGVVLVIAGDEGMGGAARLAAESALRVGVGLVHVATHPSHAALLSATRPELIVHGIQEAKGLKPYLEKANALVLGPGLGRRAWGKRLWEAALSIQKPTILDADALYFLAKEPERLGPQFSGILTPHPGEAAHLLGIEVNRLQSNPAQAAEDLQKRFGAVVVLKGPNTLIASKEGLLKNPFAQGAMATAGMGDILSGIIGGLVAQGLSRELAAELGVVFHTAAARWVISKEGEKGLIATDLWRAFKPVMNLNF